MRAVESQSRKEQLRAKRAQAHAARENDRLRATYGEKLVQAVVEATGKPLSLDSFKNCVSLPLIEWPTKVCDAPGLTAPYISRADTKELLECVRRRLSTLSGRIGFHEKSYLGSAEVHGVDPVDLLAVAESTEDSVVLYTDVPQGVLVVDFYASQPGNSFSIIVQGDELIHRLAFCFVGEVGKG